MKKKYYCNRCQEDMTEKVESKKNEQKTVLRVFTDFSNNQKEKILVKCSKRHPNLFKL